MMTVLTHLTLKEGAAPEWDVAMRQRLEAAKGRAGWVRGQLLMPLEDLTKRVIIGTWQTRADWEAWHHDAAFTETRRRLEDLEASPSETTWYEIIVEQTPPSVTGRVAGLARQLMDKARKVLPGAAG